MRKIRSGFTLVEVSLFLAITAVVFVGVAVGTSNSIFQQRYNDAVQNYVEFLRTVYSQVTNVQSEGNGRSDKVIYGKLVTFNKDSDGNKINTYNVIGDLENSTNGSSGGSVLERLEKLNVDVIVEKEGGSYGSVGFVDSYTPRWSSRIQTTTEWNDGYKIFTGALLIVRSPSSGTVYTYGTTEEIDVDNYLDELNGGVNIGNPFESSLSKFSSQYDIDFCINPNGAEKSSLRRDVRITAGARNASGVEIIQDEKEIVGDVNIGNRCE